MREPGKIHHVHGIKGLGVERAYMFIIYREKCNGKTTKSSKLDLPATHLLTQVTMTASIYASDLSSDRF